jgi:hypothetical protein
LLNIGIISSETTNNRLYYEVNKSFQFYAPLSQIFGAGQGAGEDEASEASAALKSLGNIELALYTGQFTRDDKSGVDFLLVGDINQTQLAKFVGVMEKKEGKAIRYAVMDKKEFIYRKEVNDRFLLTVLESKKQVVIDKYGLVGEGGTARAAAEEGSEGAGEGSQEPETSPNAKKSAATKKSKAAK